MACSCPKSDSCFFLIFVLSVFASGFGASKAQLPSIVDGLSWSFYDSSCPNLESIIREHLSQVIAADRGQGAGLLRLHFHDCFVLGCDASVLLNGSAGGPSEEQSAPPNLSLRQESFRIINDLKALINAECGATTVSCADIVALAARDSVFLLNGSDYQVPLGRLDGLELATEDQTLANLPAPTDTTPVLITAFAAKNLTVTDLVALSGAHTIGIANCSSFEDRLFPNRSNTLPEPFYNDLLGICPSENATNTTVLDKISPEDFDNAYFVNLLNGEGLLTSDQDLFINTTTSGIVESFANNQTDFFDNFVLAMIKMGQIDVITNVSSTAGEVRANCSVRNSNNTADISLLRVVEQVLETM